MNRLQLFANFRVGGFGAIRAVVPNSIVALVLVGAVVHLPIRAQMLKSPGPLTIAPVKEGLYMISGEGGNVAVLVTDDGVVLVDDMFERNHADILAQVASVTEHPIRYVLNTHQHDDHAGGDRLLLPLAEIIAHENVRANLLDIKQPYYEDTPGLPVGLPEVTFTDEFALFVGGQEVRAKYTGRGHTNGDVVAYFPALKTIHTGDLFLGRRSVAADDPGQSAAAPDRPRGVSIYVDYAQGGSFLDWTGTLDRVLELDFDTVIPGHGPVSTRADVVQFRADLEVMRNRIAGLIEMGATKTQVLAVFETDYGWRSTGCPPSPPTPGCLQYQQMDALIDELSR